MIAETTATSLLICADKGTVLRDGNVVQDTQIIDAYLNGFSVMEKMIVAMAPTNFPKVVRYVIRTRNSSVRIVGAYRNNGCAIFRTIAEMAATRAKLFAKGNIGNVPNQNLDARMESAFLLDGDAIARMIAATTATK